MKTIVTLEGGAITVTEQGADLFLNYDAAAGGGSLAGILSGAGSIKLAAGSVGLKAAEAFVNHILPSAAEPFATAIESYINAQVAKA